MRAVAGALCAVPAGGDNVSLHAECDERVLLPAEEHDGRHRQRPDGRLLSVRAARARGRDGGVRDAAVSAAGLIF